LNAAFRGLKRRRSSTALGEAAALLAPDLERGLFEAQPIVPRDAWLEGVVNAVIHRSYSLAGDHIRVEIYPDRVEIESPGRFPGLANPASPLLISRFARNPRIARVCADLRIGQELGEGIKRIFEEMRRVGLTDPVYKQGGGRCVWSWRHCPASTPAKRNDCHEDPKTSSTSSAPPEEA
jgi:ATP-dependent DNA helicase RecG